MIGLRRGNSIYRQNVKRREMSEYPDKNYIYERTVIKMVKVYEAYYSEDIGILQVVPESGLVEHIHPQEVENKFSTSMYARSQLQKLLDTNSVEYAEMVLNGELGRYIELCHREVKDLENSLNSYFEKHYPDATKAEVESMTREFMIYDL